MRVVLIDEGGEAQRGGDGGVGAKSINAGDGFASDAMFTSKEDEALTLPPPWSKVLTYGIDIVSGSRSTARQRCKVLGEAPPSRDSWARAPTDLPVRSYTADPSLILRSCPVGVLVRLRSCRGGLASALMGLAGGFSTGALMQYDLGDCALLAGEAVGSGRSSEFALQRLEFPLYLAGALVRLGLGEVARL